MARLEDIKSLVQRVGPPVVYGTLTGCGMLFIWTAKLFEWDQTLVLAVPIGLMLAYFSLSLLPGLRLHTEQAGDNLYYMGFLFTLTSLGVSLYRFMGGASIDDIVRNFGIAVSSTIFGILLRIFFNQMRRDPIDIERSVRHELADMTRRVRTELDSSAREFSQYRRTSNQMLEEGFEEIARQAERNGEAILKAIEALSKEAIKPIQDAAEKLAVIAEDNVRIVEDRARASNELAEAALSKLNATTNRLSDLVEGFGRSLDTVSKKLTDIRLPEEVLRVELQPALASIKELSDLQIRRLEETATHSRDQAAQMKEALQPLDDLPKRMEAAFHPLEQLPEKMQASLNPLEFITAKMQASVEPLEKFGGNIEIALKPLADVATRVEGIVTNLEKASTSTANTIKAVDQLLMRIMTAELGSSISLEASSAQGTSSNGHRQTPSLDHANGIQLTFPYTSSASQSDSGVEQEGRRVAETSSVVNGEPAGNEESEGKRSGWFSRW
ncbi:hypothetical protein [Sinorhizobium fredii]|uniref:hypothetical protein n=1 Tax=Rhizobium fredii TaxID=380 RepID=UPI0004BB5605|nr:hypothetical protein [Sinorhizobium fredii]AWI58513.1 hypothetical protein AB395_00002868 [Sinorhizobium fredii CCBAU 45436]